MYTVYDGKNREYVASVKCALCIHKIWPSEQPQWRPSWRSSADCGGCSTTVSIGCQWCHSALVEGNACNADKWVILEPHQNSPPHSLSEPYHFSLEDCMQNIHCLSNIMYTFSVWICVLLFECIILNFVSGQFLRMSDQFWLCADIGSEQLLDIIGSTAHWTPLGRVWWYTNKWHYIIDVVPEKCHHCWTSTENQWCRHLIVSWKTSKSVAFSIATGITSVSLYCEYQNS